MAEEQNVESDPINTGKNGNWPNPATRFKPGNPGRPPGPNKLTKTVKETVLQVFNELQEDPENGLLNFAKKYPRDFYAIAAKLIPTEISGKLVTTINVVETLAVGCSPMEANGN